MQSAATQFQYANGGGSRSCESNHVQRHKALGSGRSPVGRQHGAAADDIVSPASQQRYSSGHRGTARRRSLSTQGYSLWKSGTTSGCSDAAGRRSYSSPPFSSALRLATWLLRQSDTTPQRCCLFRPRTPNPSRDLHQSAQFSGTAAVTYAEIIDSVTVLGPVAERQRPQMQVDDLADMVKVDRPRGDHAHRCHTFPDPSASGSRPSPMRWASAPRGSFRSWRKSAGGRDLVRHSADPVGRRARSCQS